MKVVSPSFVKQYVIILSIFSYSCWSFGMHYVFIFSTQTYTQKQNANNLHEILNRTNVNKEQNIIIKNDAWQAAFNKLIKEHCATVASINKNDNCAEKDLDQGQQ